MGFGFAPIVELAPILLCVVVSVTLILMGITIATETEIASRLVLLLYLVPMWTIRALGRSFDPQNLKSFTTVSADDCGGGIDCLRLLRSPCQREVRLRVV
jgi:hypothetical protein